MTATDMATQRELDDYQLLLLQTGGTIDKDYPKRVGGYAFEISSPATARILDRVQPAFRVKQVTVCQKDSQDITDTDRQAVWEACRAATCRRILVTHGTDTMVDTARYLATRGLPDHCVLLTGAHKPETFKGSDADFNVGVAVGALQVMDKTGVYVAMSGQVYRWDMVVREPVTGRFVVKDPKETK